MLKKGDLIYCPGDTDVQNYPGWCEDWGVVIKVDDEK